MLLQSNYLGKPQLPFLFSCLWQEKNSDAFDSEADEVFKCLVSPKVTPPVFEEEFYGYD